MIVLSGLIGAVRAQTAAAPSAAAAAATANWNDLLVEAQAHADMVSGILGGKEQASAAVLRLKTIARPSWAKGDPDGDYGYAAIDLGSRLIAVGKPAEAALFFKVAETSFLTVLKKTPDAEAMVKAGYLQNLALIHGTYLNNPTQALVDLNQALALLPNDPYLLATRSNLLSDKAAFFQQQPQG